MTRELDKAIAEALGWKPERACELVGGWEGSSCEKAWQHRGICDTPDVCPHLTTPLHFSSYLPDAWRLVDYAIAKGWEFALWYDDYDKKYVCQMYLCEGQGDTAAEAIARAFDNTGN